MVSCWWECFLPGRVAPGKPNGVREVVARIAFRGAGVGWQRTTHRSGREGIRFHAIRILAKIFARWQPSRLPILSFRRVRHLGVRKRGRELFSGFTARTNGSQPGLVAGRQMDCVQYEQRVRNRNRSSPFRWRNTKAPDAGNTGIRRSDVAALVQKRAMDLFPARYSSCDMTGRKCAN
jgi:hypothetical protein